jgi:hypothetical protein
LNNYGGESIEVLMGFRIGVLFEVFLACPVAEISEGEVGDFVMLLEKFFEGGLGVSDLDAPGCKLSLPIDKLILADSAIPADIEMFKRKPQVVVLLEVDEEVSELSLGDVVISEGMLRFDLVLGGLIGADDDGLQFEELG